MEAQHVNVKIYLEAPEDLDLEDFIHVFQGWIQERALEELLIDVADYRHVPAGPAVLLVAHEADYGIDDADGRRGLRYNRKAAVEGSNRDRFRQALRSTLSACRKLEGESRFGGTLRFSRQELELFINDRAVAPNSEETFQALGPELEAFFREVWKHQDVRMERKSRDPRSRFGVHVQAAGPYDPEALLRELG